MNTSSTQWISFNQITGLAFWYRQEPVLARLSLATLAAIPLFIILMIIDERVVNDINIWRKPLKFHIATAIYTATLVGFCAWIDRSVITLGWFRAFTYAVVFCVVFELSWISSAALIGEPSHYNRNHAVLSILYPVMGVVAIALTSATLVIATLVATNQRSSLTAYFRLAVVAGLVISFVSTVFVASVLASLDSHWIGGSQSDQNGLRFLGWSRDGGDLRVAHFFSLHAMHFLPLAALVVLPPRLAAHPRWMVFSLSVLYIALIVYTYIQAQHGMPFLPWLGTR